MKRNNVYILEDRGLLYVSGEDCKEFLQNIVTNNINNVNLPSYPNIEETMTIKEFNES